MLLVQVREQVLGHDEQALERDEEQQQVLVHGVELELVLEVPQLLLGLAQVLLHED